MDRTQQSILLKDFFLSLLHSFLSPYYSTETGKAGAQQAACDRDEEEAERRT